MPIGVENFNFVITYFQSSSRFHNFSPINVIHWCKIDFQKHTQRNLTYKVLFYLWLVNVNVPVFDIRHIYTAALDALGKSRRPVEALNIFHAMQVMHVIHAICSFLLKYIN